MAGIIRSCSIMAAAALLAACAQAATLHTRSELQWLQQTEQQAIDSGISPAVVHEALDGFTPNPRVVELDQKQPETTVTFETYRRNTVSSARLKKGAELMRLYAPALKNIEARTGVPPQMVLALWAVESSFGQNQGDFETVNALATLAYEGRRADFFRAELFATLHILEREHRPANELRGSWAGAMGQCQFMPSTYLKYAVDGDGDGRIDIWNDPTDVLASIANYLAAEGWQSGTPWGIPVEGGAPSPAETGLAQSRSVREWTEIGVAGIGGLPLPQSDMPASFVQPDGPGGPSFLVYDNIRPLMRWNRSTYFALAVGLLADGIKGN